MDVPATTSSSSSPSSPSSSSSPSIWLLTQLPTLPRCSAPFPPSHHTLPVRNKTPTHDKRDTIPPTFHPRSSIPDPHHPSIKKDRGLKSNCDLAVARRNLKDPSFPPVCRADTNVGGGGNRFLFRLSCGGDEGPGTIQTRHTTDYYHFLKCKSVTECLVRWVAYSVEAKELQLRLRRGVATDDELNDSSLRFGFVWYRVSTASCGWK
jgi:hypothetical protein